MTEKKANEEKAAELRKRAEEIYRKGAKKPTSSGQRPLDAETQDIIQELRVHQIELEMQNGELRKTQVELDAARSRYFDMYAMAPVGYITLDEADLIQESNIPAAALLGLPRGTLERLPISRFIRNEDQDVFYLKRNALFRTGDPEDFELRMKDHGGKGFWGRLSATAYRDDGGALFCRVAISDITAQKESEEKVRRNESRLRMLVDIMQHPADTVGELLGYALDQAVQLTESAIGYLYGYDEASRLLSLKAWSKGLEGQEPPECQRALGIDETGEWGEAVRLRRPIIVNRPRPASLLGNGYPEEYPHPVKFIALPVFNGESVAAVMGLANKESDYSETDVLQVSLLMDAVWKESERKRAELALAEEKERLAVTLGSIGEGVISVAPSGRIMHINRMAEELCGWTQAQARDADVASVLSVLDETTREPLPSILARVLGDRNEAETRAILVSRDGSESNIALSGAPLMDSDGGAMGAVFVFRDITEMQRLVETIQRNDKLASLGILAGGLAHDFNNLLAGIFGYLSLALQGCAARDDEVTRNLEKAHSLFPRAKELGQRLLTFSSGGGPIRTTGPISPLLRETAAFVLSGSDIACEFSIAQDLRPCDFDGTQMGQVFSNLLMNARQAMPEGGKIAITAVNLPLGDGQVPSLPSGDYVKISIADMGIGMPPNMLKRVFDPFFTTKSMGRGLGLSICHSIMLKHGGAIDVDSKQGSGSVFHLYLPAAAGTRAAAKDRDPPPARA
jgi:PAS domain S-box-containing protein